MGGVGYDEVLAGREIAGEGDAGGGGHPADRRDQDGEQAFGEAVGGVAAVAFGGGAQQLVAVGGDDGDAGCWYGGVAGFR